MSDIPQPSEASFPLPDIDWVWTDSAVYDLLAPTLYSPLRKSAPGEVADSLPSGQYPDSLADFQIFDLRPGDKLSWSSATFSQFVQTFPSRLPNITPSLYLLCRTVTGPLLSHARSISSSLVDIFLSDSSPYHLPTHLNLLKSYLLMTSPAFKLQLQQSLFAFGSTAFDSIRNTHCVLGLSPKLTADGSWPPAGSNLSLSLRTVILDALAQDYDCLPNLTTRQIVKEAEWRLGFAIRDLPLDSGRAQWLNSTGKVVYLYKEDAPTDVWLFSYSVIYLFLQCVM